MKKPVREPINWVNTLFLTLCPLLSVTGTILLCLYTTISWKTWVLFGVSTALTGFAITGGYHRLFAHKAYRTTQSIRLLYLLVATAAFEGSVLEWCTDHRKHHRHTDTESDPYNIKRGFWYAHMGWLIRLDNQKRDFSNVIDLKADRLCRLQHRFYSPLAAIIGFALPAAIASIWGEPLAGLVIAGGLRVTLNHHFTFFINSLCHTLGKRPYSEQESARDHWLAAIFTYGEGYHNFHHRFPIDYRNGIEAHHYDPTKWLIWSLSKLGLASDLNRVSPQRIAQSILESHASNTASYLTHAREKITALIRRVECLEKEYREHIKTTACKITISRCRRNLRKLNRELNQAMNAWVKLTNS